ncbi:MAG: hypothetical protein K9M75_07160 [Phycisphaerae bacterium]|nr:hypothetical protein [Phycisphaerae bacterium]
MYTPDQKKTLKKIRRYLIIFFLGILFSLHTVLFVEVETAFLVKHLGHGTSMEQKLPFVSAWIENLYTSVKETYTNYPVIAYCMDWLSYACVVFAIFMIGAIKDPVKNIWIIQTYMLACLLAAALPFIAGPFREIPIFWRCLDGSFGLIGFFVLLMPYKLTKSLSSSQTLIITKKH